jgi:hypothetical protein
MTKPLAVAGGFFWITMNIIETVDNFLTEHKIILNKHVPFKVLQLHCEERQDIYGLFRTLSVYCVSNNNKIRIESNMRNDFFESSDMKIIVTKTYPGTSKSEDFNMVLKGDNEIINGWYDLIKNKYYLPHINTKVFPKQ